jgi:predicted acetyltransferase
VTELVAPSERYRASFLAADAESMADGTGRGITEDTFSALLARFEQYASGRDLPPNRVRETTLWLVEGDEYIGRISLRHALTPLLVVIGGHVGYDVRPSQRRQGHATRMLRLAIPHLAALGIDPALITCDDDNVASCKVIEACGGRLATDEVDIEAALAVASDEARTALAVPRRRYWLPTHAQLSRPLPE